MQHALRVILTIQVLKHLRVVVNKPVQIFSLRTHGGSESVARLGVMRWGVVGVVVCFLLIFGVGFCVGGGVRGGR